VLVDWKQIRLPQNTKRGTITKEKNQKSQPLDHSKVPETNVEIWEFTANLGVISDIFNLFRIILISINFLIYQYQSPNLAYIYKKK